MTVVCHWRWREENGDVKSEWVISAGWMKLCEATLVCPQRFMQQKLFDTTAQGGKLKLGRLWNGCFLQFRFSVYEIYAMFEPAMITERFEMLKVWTLPTKPRRQLETIKYFYSACEYNCSNLDLIMQRLFTFIFLFIQLREELLCTNTFFSRLGSVFEK